jgi:hypothetical protein
MAHGCDDFLLTTSIGSATVYLSTSEVDRISRVWKLTGGYDDPRQELEKRDDPEKVRGRPGVILGREKGKIYSDSDNPEVLDALRWPGGRRKVPGRIRQTG